jgi:hypothetical protein
MFKAKAHAAVLAVAAAVALPSCGGGGGETIPKGTLTKQQFLQQAKPVCARGLAEINKADLAAWERYEADHTTTDEAVLNKVSLALVPGMERQVHRLRAIGLPKGMSGKYGLEGC